MVVTGFRVFVGDQLTGKITADLPVAKLAWGMRLNDAADLSASIVMNAAELRSLEVRSATAPIKQFIGVAFEGEILEAGPILKRKYDPSTETLDLTAAGIWSLLDRRLALNWPDLLANPDKKVTDTNLLIKDRTLGSIGRELVRGSVEDNPYGRLPIVLPSAAVEAGNYRTVQGYSLSTVGQLLRNLTGVINGPDIRFKPRFNASDPTLVEWVMEHGTPDVPILTQAGPDWVWDGTVEKSGVVGFGVEESAEALNAKVWQPGAGTERDMQIASASDLVLVRSKYPWTESVIASKEVDSQTVLQQAADYGIAATKRPVATWSITVDAESTPILGSYRPGDWAQLTVPENHPLLDAGMARTRIMAIDGDGSNQVKIGVAPLLTEV